MVADCASRLGLVLRVVGGAEQKNQDSVANAILPALPVVPPKVTSRVELRAAHKSIFLEARFLPCKYQAN